MKRGIHSGLFALVFVCYSLPFLVFTTCSFTFGDFFSSCSGKLVAMVTGWEAVTTARVGGGDVVSMRNPRGTLIAVLVIASAGALISPFRQTFGRVTGVVLGLAGALVLLGVAATIGFEIGLVVAGLLFLSAAGWGIYRQLTRPEDQPGLLTPNRPREPDEGTPFG